MEISNLFDLRSEDVLRYEDIKFLESISDKSHPYHHNYAVARRLLVSYRMAKLKMRALGPVLYGYLTLSILLSFLFFVRLRIEVGVFLYVFCSLISAMFMNIIFAYWWDQYVRWRADVKALPLTINDCAGLHGPRVEKYWRDVS